jgi:Holliday junction resolvase RusA-like endonuclease
MSGALDFFVLGKPQTAGSKTAVPTPGGPRVIEAGSKESRARKKTWRGDCRDAALAAIDGADGWPWDGPVRVVAVFRFHRPKGHYGAGRNERVPKPSAPAFHLQDPDASKVWRAAEDALTGVCWVDDNRIVGQSIVKRWACRFTEREGLDLTVIRVEDD